EGLRSALEDVESAISAGVEDPEAYWARAFLSLLTGTKGSPLADFKKAVELAPLEAAYQANLAAALCGMPIGTPGALEHEEGAELHGDDDALGEAELHFGLACELAPDNTELKKERDVFLDLLQKKEAAHK